MRIRALCWVADPASRSRTASAQLNTIVRRRCSFEQNILGTWLARSLAFTALKASATNARESALRCIRAVDRHLSASCTEACCNTNGSPS